MSYWICTTGCDSECSADLAWSGATQRDGEFPTRETGGAGRIHAAAEGLRERGHAKQGESGDVTFE